MTKDASKVTFAARVMSLLIDTLPLAESAIDPVRLNACPEITFTSSLVMAAIVRPEMSLLFVHWGAAAGKSIVRLLSAAAGTLPPCQLPESDQLAVAPPPVHTWAASNTRFSSRSILARERLRMFVQLQWVRTLGNVPHTSAPNPAGLTSGERRARTLRMPCLQVLRRGVLSDAGQAQGFIPT